MKFGFDVRREHDEHRVHQPAQRRPDVQRRPVTGNAAADFLLGLPSSSRRTTTNQAIQDGVRLALRRLCAGRVAAWRRT